MAPPPLPHSEGHNSVTTVGERKAKTRRVEAQVSSGEAAPAEPANADAAPPAEESAPSDCGEIRNTALDSVLNPRGEAEIVEEESEGEDASTATKKRKGGASNRRVFKIAQKLQLLDLLDEGTSEKDASLAS